MTWTSSFISPDEDADAAPLLRRQFSLDDAHGAVVSATLTLTALGVCEAWINGSPVSDEVLTPGWSSYEWRLRYRTYDVTALIAPDFVLGIALGNGWYRGRLGWSNDRAVYGDELAAFAELRVEYSDGFSRVFGTDSSWTSGASAVTANDLYEGQSIDARLRDDGWLQPGYDSSDWSGVRPIMVDLAKLEPYIGPPVRRQEDVPPVAVWKSPSGKVLIDFGQNLVGWLRVQVTGPAGSVVTLRHAEVLEDDELGTRPLRTAEATDRFTLSGGYDIFEPTFTFHGFRYAEVEGWPTGIEGLLQDGGVTAVVVSSDLRRIGYLETSSPQLNQLHSNTLWGMRGNFLDVPSDCPQRDERLGWTGDIAAFAPTAAFLYDANDFLRDWLRDLALEQENADGVVPIVVPDVLKLVTLPEGFPQPGPTAIWGDASVWVPWALWWAYGDATVLTEQFASMASHARAVGALLGPSGSWDEGFQFGDWLDPAAPSDQPWASKADRHVVATLCAYRTARIVADVAEVLDRSAEQVEFTRQAERIRAGFAMDYLADGKIQSDATTVYTLAIVFDILDAADREAAGVRLAELVAESGYHISTGFAGTPFVLDALADTGHLDAAYRLLLQTENPSWLYPITMGATTIWERWDSVLPDGSINPGEMTSFNHYALGAVSDWLHRRVGGIAPLEPGYRTVLIEPKPGGELSWARCRLDTPHGEVAVEWSREQEGRIVLEATVPPGAEAVLRIPGREEERVGPGLHRR